MPQQKPFPMRLRIIAMPYIVLGTVELIHTLCLILIDPGKRSAKSTVAVLFLVVIVAIGVGLLRYRYNSWLFARAISWIGIIYSSLCILVCCLALFVPTLRANPEEPTLRPWITSCLLLAWFWWQRKTLNELRYSYLRDARTKKKERRRAHFNLITLFLLTAIMAAATLRISTSSSVWTGRLRISTFPSEDDTEIRQYRVWQHRRVFGMQKPLKYIILQTWNDEVLSSRRFMQFGKDRQTMRDISRFNEKRFGVEQVDRFDTPVYESEFYAWEESKPADFTPEALIDFVKASRAAP